MVAKILVLGAGGMLGHALVATLLEAGVEVAATLRAKAPSGGPLLRFAPRENLVEDCDLLAPGRLEAVVADSGADVVVNCVGMTKQKEIDGDAALTVALNALLPHRLAASCRLSGARLVHVSTDCVFSGSRGRYAESDLPDPPDLYGRSKLAGEVDAPHLTLRTSLIGWQIAGAESLISWFWTQRGGRVRGYRRAIFSGLTTYAFARILRDVIIHHPGLAGVYHVAAEPISKHDLLASLNRIAGRPVEIEPTDAPEIDRSLDGARFVAATGVRSPPWDEMIAELHGLRSMYDEQ